MTEDRVLPKMLTSYIERRGIPGKFTVNEREGVKDSLLDLVKKTHSLLDGPNSTFDLIKQLDQILITLYERGSYGKIRTGELLYKMGYYRATILAFGEAIEDYLQEGWEDVAFHLVLRLKNLLDRAGIKVERIKIKYFKHILDVESYG